jgi:hypothetical protein
MFNKFMVGAQGNDIVVGLASRTARMSKEDALELAAWLVSMASTDIGKEFIPKLAEIQGEDVDITGYQKYYPPPFDDYDDD